MVNRVEENTGHFALLQTFVLAHTSYLMKLKLDELGQHLEVVLHAVTFDVFTFGLKVLSQEETSLCEWRGQLDISWDLRTTC